MLRKFPTKHDTELGWWAEVEVATQNNLAQQGLRPNIAEKRKLSWESRTLGGAALSAALASVVQAGKIQGVGLAEYGA